MPSHKPPAMLCHKQIDEDEDIIICTILFVFIVLCQMSAKQSIAPYIYIYADVGQLIST